MNKSVLDKGENDDSFTQWRLRPRSKMLSNTRSISRRTNQPMVSTRLVAKPCFSSRSRFRIPCDQTRETLCRRFKRLHRAEDGTACPSEGNDSSKSCSCCSRTSRNSNSHWAQSHLQLNLTTTTPRPRARSRPQVQGRLPSTQAEPYPKLAQERQ